MTNEDVVALAVLAAELGTTVDELVVELGQEDVFRDGAGFRCCAVSRASELIAARERRQEEAAERAERRAAEARARAAERRQAGIERGRALREAGDRGESRVQEMRISHLTEVQSTGDVLPVVAMTATSDKQFEDGVYRPVPSRLPRPGWKAEQVGASRAPARRKRVVAALRPSRGAGPCTASRPLPRDAGRGRVASDGTADRTAILCWPWLSTAVSNAGDPRFGGSTSPRSPSPPLPA